MNSVELCHYHADTALRSRAHGLLPRVQALREAEHLNAIRIFLEDGYEEYVHYCNAVGFVPYGSHFGDDKPLNPHTNG